MQTSERLCPTADFAGGRSRSKWGGMLVMLQCDTKAACEE
jgi:hypothetical protein